MAHARRKMTAVLSILGIAAPAGMLLAAASAQDLQNARHEHYHELGDAFKTVRDQARAGAPVIWQKPEDFKAAQKMFSDAAPKLLSAASAGDLDAVKSTYGELGNLQELPRDLPRARRSRLKLEQLRGARYSARPFHSPPERSQRTMTACTPTSAGSVR
jgi:hypothetical protein